MEQYAAHMVQAVGFRFAIGLVWFGMLVGSGAAFGGVWLFQRTHGSRLIRLTPGEMIHIQRMAMMGQAAAALVHDVSQPLSAAGNYFAALRRTAGNTASADRDRKLSELAERTNTQINRASEILHRVRRFMEKREPERQGTQAGRMIEDAVALIGPVGNGVEFTIDVEAGLPQLMTDEVQIQQVIVNLIRNGLDAMRGCAHRHLSLSVKSEGRYAVIFSIADTGIGLPTAMADTLFEPFVSFKPGGLGIGLAICRKIIAEHQGVIWAEPNPAGGTIFRFRLPAAPAT